jgi:hypothetical protein
MAYTTVNNWIKLRVFRLGKYHLRISKMPELFLSYVFLCIHMHVLCKDTKIKQISICDSQHASLFLVYVVKHSFPVCAYASIFVCLTDESGAAMCINANDAMTGALLENVGLK